MLMRIKRRVEPAAAVSAVTPDEAEDASKRLPVALRERLTAMSPMTYVRDLRAPLIVLLHDRDDPVIRWASLETCGTRWPAVAGCATPSSPCSVISTRRRATRHAQALVHNLRPDDWGRPLSEIRDAFWNAPRLPLLPGGDSDLQRAIFAAVTTKQVRLLDKDGNERAAERATDINVGSSGLRLQRYVDDPNTHVTVEVPLLIALDQTAVERLLHSVGLYLVGSGEGHAVSQRPAAGTGSQFSESEFQVTLSLTKSMSDDSKRNSARQLLRELADAVDTDASHLTLSVKIVA